MGAIAIQFIRILVILNSQGSNSISRNEGNAKDLLYITFSISSQALREPIFASIVICSSYYISLGEFRFIYDDVDMELAVGYEKRHRPSYSAPTLKHFTTSFKG